MEKMKGKGENEEEKKRGEIMMLFYGACRPELSRQRLVFLRCCFAVGRMGTQMDENTRVLRCEAFDVDATAKHDRKRCANEKVGDVV
jgi:hypothetical protein